VIVRRLSLPALILALAFLCASCTSGETSPPINDAGHADGALLRAPSSDASPTVPEPADTKPGWLLAGHATDSRLMYLAAGNKVLIFPKSGFDRSPIGVITQGITGAYGLFVDRDGSLYVCNQTGSVNVYRRGQLTPHLTYSAELNRPLYVAVDYDRVFVGNANDGKIIEFRKGNSAVRRVIQTFGGEVDGINFDAEGNLYAAYRGPLGGGGIERFLKGSSVGSDLGIVVDQPQGLVVDRSGNIIVAETGVNRIEVFPPGQTTAGRTLAYRGAPTGVQLGRDERSLFVSGNNRIYVSPYPALSGPVWKDGRGRLIAIQGLAVSPPAEP
jgi:hypothetical protein